MQVVNGVLLSVIPEMWMISCLTIQKLLTRLVGLLL